MAETEQGKRKYNPIARENGSSSARYGELREHNVQINELPQEGACVIVNECHTYARTKGEQNVWVIYHPSVEHLDAWNFPLIYTVVSYTKGRENPLDPANNIILEHTARTGFVRRTQIRTILIATGSMELEVVPKDMKFNTPIDKKIWEHLDLCQEFQNIKGKWTGDDSE